MNTDTACGLPYEHSPIATVLVADDEEVVLRLCSDLIRDAGFRPLTARNTEEALRILQRECVDVAITDIRIPQIGGMNLAKHIHRTYPNLGIMLLTQYGTIDSAVEAMRLGAIDYVQKPFKCDEFTEKLRLHVQGVLLETRRHAETVHLRSHPSQTGLLGSSRSMMEVRVLIERVSQHSYPVIVLGESGTGKELTAQAIHNLGPRAHCPFVPVDCSSLTPSLVEAELFGHAKGAFTGAIQGREGLIETAHMGTLFLDEIAEIPKEMQVKLLRVLQERQVRRIGSNETKTVDIRVIAATNKDLREEIRAGRFREDLYYRLNVVELQLPPLRARKADIPILVSAFIERHSCHGRRIEVVSADAWDKLMSFDWPGNVRQLENTIARAIALGSGPTLSRTDLLLDPEIGGDSPPGAWIKGQSLESVEKAAILGALREAEGSRILAAQMLGIGKTTLYRKLRLYGEAE